MTSNIINDELQIGGKLFDPAETMEDNLKRKNKPLGKKILEEMEKESSQGMLQMNPIRKQFITNDFNIYEDWKYNSHKLKGHEIRLIDPHFKIAFRCLDCDIDHHYRSRKNLRIFNTIFESISKEESDQKLNEILLEYSELFKKVAANE